MPHESVSKRRREREQTEMRARLLEVARQIAVEEGWQAVTIRRIADRIEYTSPILYRYFAGKDALLLTLAEEGFRQIADCLREAGTLAAIATAYWDFAFASPELYQVMHGLDGVPFGTAETPPVAREAFILFREMLVTLADAEGHPLVDPSAAADTIWAYLHGFVSLAMSHRIAGPPARARTLMLDALPGLFASLPRT